MRRVCVFCGSNPGSRPEYREGAQRLGKQLASEGLGLVFGGGSVGLMGAIAEAVLAEGGEIIGVLPEALKARELGHASLPHLRIVGTMHERKAMMASLADAFIAMPGGMGTLDELCEIITWAQLGIHAKPVGLLDLGGYWRPFLGFVDHAVSEGFVLAEHRAMLSVEEDPARLLEAMRASHPPKAPQWIRTKDV